MTAGHCTTATAAGRVKGRASAMASPAMVDVLSVTDLAKWPIVAGSDVICYRPR